MPKLKPDIKITDLIKRHDFVISAEVTPSDEALDRAHALINTGVHFLALSKNPGGVHSAPAIPLIENLALPCVAHLTCVGSTSRELAVQVLELHQAKIRNILALRGDRKEQNPNENTYAHELIAQIKALNLDICIGAAAYPDALTEHERVDFLKKKIDAGASFAMTQILTNVQSYSRFIEETSRAKIKIPILPGLHIFTSKSQAQAMAKKFQFVLPQKVLEQLPIEARPDDDNKLIDDFFSLASELKRAGAPGIHLFVMDELRLSCKVLTRLNESLQKPRP